MSEETTTEPTTTETAETTESSWTSSLPEELQSSKSLEKFKDVEGLARSYLEAEKGLSSRLKVPEKDDQEGWDQVFSQLGRPESADKYDLEGIQNAEVAQSEENKATIDRFKEVGHKYGLSNRQVAGIIDDVLGMTVEQQRAAGEAREADVAALKQEFGNQFDARVELANSTLRQMVEKSGGDFDRLSEALVQSGMTSNPDLVKALAGIGRMMQQDKLYGAGGEPRSMTGMTPPEIKARIDQITVENLEDLKIGNANGQAKQAEINKLIEMLGQAV